MWIFIGIVSFTMFFGYGIWHKLSWAMSWQGEKGYLKTTGNQPYKFKDTTFKNVRNFIFAVPCASAVSLRIHRETRWDRFAKKIGLSYEFQFNDPEFDDELYVVSNAPAFRVELAETRALRHVLRLLFRDQRLKRIECHGQHVVARYREKVESGTGTTPNATEVNQVVAALNALAESLAAAKSKTTSSWDVYQLRATLLAALATAFLMLGALEFFRIWGFERARLMLDVGGLLTFSTLCAGAVLFALMTATVTLLRGSSYAHIILAEMIISGGAGLMMASYVMVRDINISFDQSAQRMVEADVIYKRTSSGRRSRTHYLYLSGFDGSRQLPESIEVSSEVYCKAKPTWPVTLVVRDGALGYRWIEAYKFN
jgi:hypothetical protein